MLTNPADLRELLVNLLPDIAPLLAAAFTRLAQGQDPAPVLRLLKTHLERVEK